MKKLFGKLRTHGERKRFYLHEAREEIVRTNMSTLRYASLITVVVLVILLILAKLILREWSPSPYHYAMLPVAIALCIAAWAVGDNARYRTCLLLCALYQAAMYLSIIAIDTLGGPDAPSSFVQLVCVALPALFVLPSSLTYGLLIAAEALYTALVILMKNSFIAQYDIYGMITGLLFAVAASQLVMESRLKAHELKLRFETMSKRDTLSSLYNKRAFFESAKRYLDAHNPRSTCSLAVIDIDDFKKVNDTLGHDMGDKLLSRMGDILLELYRPTDLIARFGGDEYLVLADRLIDEGIIERRFGELSTRINEEALEKIGMPVTFSMGVVCVEGQEADFSELFQQADEALYAVKQGGKNACAVKRYHGRETTNA